MSWLTSDSTNGGKEQMSNMVNLHNKSNKMLPLHVRGADGAIKELGAGIMPNTVVAIPQESCGLDPYASYIAKGHLVPLQPGQTVPAPTVRSEFPGAVVTPRTADFAASSPETPNMPVISHFGQGALDYVPPPAGQVAAPIITAASVAHLPPRVAAPAAPVASAPAVPVAPMPAAPVAVAPSPVAPAAPAAAVPVASMPAAPVAIPSADAGTMIPTAPGKGRKGRPPGSGKGGKKGKEVAAQQAVAAQPPSVASATAQPPVVQAPPQPVALSRIPINPLTGKPMWVQTGPLLPDNPNGYIIKPAPPGMPPGQALLIPVEALGEHNPELRSALAQATNQILQEATSKSGGADVLAGYGGWTLEMKEQFIANATDIASLNKIIQSEPDGKLSLMAQQRAGQVYNQQVSAQSAQPVAPAAPVATQPAAPATPGGQGS